jgi:hypothetical protein
MPAFGYQPVTLSFSFLERAAGLGWEAFPSLAENKSDLLKFPSPLTAWFRAYYSPGVLSASFISNIELAFEPG